MSGIDRTPPFYLGIDLGGTNIKSGVVDDRGRSLSSVSLETHSERGPDAGVETLAEAGRSAVQESGVGWSEIKAVGLGSPGTMDIDAGLLLEPPNLLGWENLPVRKLLEDKLQKTTILQNDGNAAAYGEFWAGAGRGVQNLVLFTLGTGIGGGIIHKGRLIQGQHSHGAECGHIVIQMENGRRCSCGKLGHLEAYASATALVDRVIEALERGADSTLGETARQGRLNGKTVADAAKAGDPLASRLMSETAFYLAVGATNLMHTFDPDLILFGGGMVGAGETFLAEIRAHVKELAFPIPAERTLVRYAELGGSAGYIGAAGCARASFEH